MIEEVRAQIRESAAGPLHFDLDYLSPALFAADPSGKKRILPFLQQKYSGRDFDVVLTIGEQSSIFAGRFQTELFRGANLVFVVVNPTDIQQWQTVRTGRTGVVETREYAPTLRVALRQNPNTRRVIVIVGSSEIEKGEMKAARDEFRSYESSVQFEYWSDLRLPEMAGRSAKLDRGSVVLMLDLLMDGSGEQFIPESALPVLAKSSTRPIYATFSSLVGDGAVGGDVVDLREVGRAVGQTTRRILNGERPESIPIVTGTFQHYAFDWRLMKKWGIHEDQLPNGSELLYREYSPWELYRWRFIGLLAILLAESVLIAVLLRMRRQRKRAEQRLSYQLKLERLVAQLASSFIAPQSKGLSNEIERALQVLLETLELDRACLFDVFPGSSQLRLLQSREAPGVGPPPLEIETSHIPWATRLLLEGQSIVLSRWDDLPEAEAATKQLLLGLGIRSLAALPMKSESRVFGVLTLSRVRHELHWTPEVISYLQVIADILSSSMMRAQAEQLLQTEKMFTNAIRGSIPGLLYVFDDKGHPVAWNDKAEEITGYSAEEIKQMRLLDWFDADDALVVTQGIGKAFAEGQASAEANVRTKNGNRIPFYLTAVSVNLDGKPHLTGVGIDVTELRQAEKELARINRQNEMILESAGEGILGIDIEGNHTFVNPAASRMFGYEPGELLGRCSHSTWHHTRANGAPYPREDCPIYAASRDGTVHRGINEVFWRKDGTRLCADYVSTPIREDGKILGAVVVFQDVTERARALEALQASEEKFSKLFRASPAMVTVASLREDRFIEVNEVFEQATGYSREEAIGHTSAELRLWSNPPEMETYLRRLSQQGTLRNVECRFRIRNGDIRDALLSSELIEVDGERCSLSSVMDITDRKRAEDALRESEQRFRLMADSAPVLMWLSGPDGRRIDFNKEWLSFVGRSHVQEVGEGWIDNIHPEDRQLSQNIFTKAFNHKHIIRLEYRLRRHDGQYRWLLDNGVPRFLKDGTFAGYIGCCVDFTDQKEAENGRMLMTGRFISAQEEERSRIARELHDDINQRMALLANGFRQLDHAISQNRAGLLESQRLYQLTTEISTAVQVLSHQLHSSKLEYLGLAAAVRSLCHDYSTSHGIEVDCIVQDVPSNLDLRVSLSIFRCVQEALRNVAKHSHAKHAKVELSGDARSVRLRVSDDGVGFDSTDPTSQSGLGLVSMGERLKWVGGKLSIWSKPSLGTQVEGIVPISAKHSDDITSMTG